MRLKRFRHTEESIVRPMERSPEAGAGTMTLNVQQKLSTHATELLSLLRGAVVYREIVVLDRPRFARALQIEPSELPRYVNELARAGLVEHLSMGSVLRLAR